MAWPFSSAVAPNKDSGFVAVTNAPNSNPPNFDNVTAGWLMGVNFANGNNFDVFVYLADGAGNLIFPGLRIPANDAKPFEWPFMPTTGLQWWTTAPSLVTGKVWGYA